MRKRTELPTPETAEHEDDDPQFVTALARGLDVLRAFKRNDPAGGLANQDLARRTGLPKATVSRLTYTLSRLGFLVYAPDLGRYRLGVAALSLGFTALGSVGIREVARPLMQQLAAETGSAVSLGSRDRMSMIYIEACRSDSPVTIGLGVGSHVKLGTSAMGRAYIAGLAEADRVALFLQLARHEGERWPDVQAGLEVAVADVARRGFTLSAGDWKAEISAVGAPLGIGDGDLAFSLNCGGPTYLFPRKRLVNDLGPRLVDLARRIREKMGSD